MVKDVLISLSLVNNIREQNKCVENSKDQMEHIIAIIMISLKKQVNVLIDIVS